MFPQFKYSNHICANPKLYQLQDSNLLEIYLSFKLKVLCHEELTCEWQAEKTGVFIANGQFVTADKLLGELILDKE